MSGVRRLLGPVLWQDTPGGQARWVDGAWDVAGRVTRRVPDSPPDEVVRGYTIPGLVDVHCHLGYGAGGLCDEAQTIADARAVAASGVTLVRDAGAPSNVSDCLLGRDDVPALIRCGRHIARPKRYLRGLPIEVEDPDDLAREMARQARRGDGWVKIVGDWIDRAEGGESRLRPLWTSRQLRDGIAAAHAEGARVCVHTFSHEAIDPLLDAGIDGIEHGTGMSADQARRAAEAGIPVTPTLLQVGLFDEFAQAAGNKYPRYRDQMHAMWRDRRAHFARLVEAGVQLLPGTDSGGYQPFGSIPAELQAWAAYGMAPADVVDMATWRARAFLGVPALHEGAPADYVTYDADPTVSLDVLDAPRLVVRERSVLARA